LASTVRRDVVELDAHVRVGAGAQRVAREHGIAAVQRARLGAGLLRGRLAGHGGHAAQLVGGQTRARGAERERAARAHR
jgi:hypothetical protein